MNTTLWEWLKAFPYGSEVRRYTPPEAYLQYRRRMQIGASFWFAGVILKIGFFAEKSSPVAARVAIVTLLMAGAAFWIAASIRYVLAWDELQRRALAESGAITAFVLVGILALYSVFEKFFELPQVPTMAWCVTGVAIWVVALPLIRRYYES